ncbi:MAG: hypothetical protein ISQ39_06650 [Alphaproteobacteria bacterium]|nr:hypothetical protein [Alphaproteobacteria bacterium]
MIFFIAFISILALEEPHVKNFLVEASKAGPVEYKFVKPVNCKSGKYKSTYVLAQNERVVLKQVSKDRTIGPVCIK